MPEELRKPRFSFHQKLLLSIVTTFLIFGVCISFFQYKREKAFRIDLMTDQLQSYNNLVFETIRGNGVCDSCIFNVIQFLKVQDLRVTIVNYSGEVLYDSQAKHLGNHADRPEIKAALATGKGISVRRLSKTTGQNFFYAATRYPEYIIRSSRPYDQKLYQQLSVDYNFLTFTILLLLILLYYIFRSTRRLGKTIEQLRDFAESADKDQPLDVNQDFPRNELGEISQHIVSLFSRIKTTRDDLMVEREKLIAHLQSAHEGLAVFTPDKKELIANNVFIQYINLISDEPVESAKAIFELPELKEISQYIAQNQSIRGLIGHLQQYAIQVDKNGKIFHVQCIIFQDRSFEVSINDITLSEEESALKRQLTQNIAHELKTPVSSIQGYMETIIDNPDLPADKLKSFIERSFLQSKRLSELLRDISTLTRMDEAPRMLE
ncbi:MAG: histidine kinase dimerization/phospho-acceptor domain-containing protein, partial [Bacteroidota bacterium]|nr:histidine kinase dimerization/phospho-acceptor domain-containing protein [Bacteroidota bacterium]